MPRELLYRYPLLSLLEPDQLDTWLAAGQEHTCATGETLLQAGTLGAWAFLVLDGQVRVVRSGRLRREVTLGKLLPGDLFGEYALVPPGHNTATCRAAGPARLYRLPLEPLRATLAGRPGVWADIKQWARLHTLLAYLRDRCFLGFLSPEMALDWHGQAHPLTYESGQTLQAPGLADDRWFYIEAGEVLLRSPGPASERRLGPGDCFGAHALAGLARLPTAEAVSAVRCLALPRRVFQPPTPDPSARLQTVNPLARAGVFDRVWVGQQVATECGLAALAMIARCRGLPVSLAEMRPLARLSTQGLSLAQLQRLARVLRLPCLAVRVTASRLAEVHLPAIAHLHDGHFVVLFQLGPTGVVVGDPACGVVTLGLAHLEQRFSGHLLVFPPPADLRPHPNGMAGKHAPVAVSQPGERP